MSLSVPLEPPSKEILHISAHYLVILVKYIYSIQFKKRFLNKVVHKIDRLRKFNRAREIEFNIFIARTIFINTKNYWK